MFFGMGDQKIDADEFSMETEQSTLPPQQETMNNAQIIFYKWMQIIA